MKCRLVGRGGSCTLSFEEEAVVWSNALIMGKDARGIFLGNGGVKASLPYPLD